MQSFRKQMHFNAGKLQSTSEREQFSSNRPQQDPNAIGNLMAPDQCKAAVFGF